MARTALTVQDIVATGLTPAYPSANVDGHSVPNDNKTFLTVKNGGGGACEVTVQTPRQEDGLDLAERVVSVPAGAERDIGPFPPKSYNQTSGADAGSIYVDFDQVTSVTVTAKRLP